MKRINESSCDCSACKGACKTSPCFGTPSEMARLIVLGHSKKLMNTVWVNPFNGVTSELIAPKFQDGRCIFLNADDKCDIHSIKPIEGRIIHHTLSFKETVLVRMRVLEFWNSIEAKELIINFEKHQ